MVSQLPLPLLSRTAGSGTLVIGSANRAAIEALGRPADWPFGTAVLVGPRRSGKSALAARFGAAGLGDAIDDAHRIAEEDLFHRWNRAQEGGQPLLIVSGPQPWSIALPDLSSRLGAALQIAIEQPDEEMLRELILSHAQARGLTIAPEVLSWLTVRLERSHSAAEAIVATADRISLSRKAPLSQAIFREALAELGGEWQPNLL